MRSGTSVMVLVLATASSCVTAGIEGPQNGGTTGSTSADAGAGTGGAPSDTGGAPSGTGGAPSGTGGASSGTGGAPTGTGGAPTGTGGRASTGGTTATGTGGRASTGGATATGGRANTGGATGTGGASTSSGGAAGPAVAAEVVFVGDFETGTLSQWSYVERCQNDRILVYSTANAPAGAPAPRQGQYAARFHVLDSDIAPCTSTENPRAEVETPETLFKPGDERWEAWSIFIPSSHPAPRGTGWFAVQEDYGAPWDGSPSIGWFLDFETTPHRFRMDRGDQYGHDQPAAVAMAKDKWVDWVVHKKFANTANGGGFIEAWIDNSPVTFSACNCTKLMMQTMHSTQQSLGFYLTAYREHGLFDSFDVFYDAVRIGTTRAAVEIR